MSVAVELFQIFKGLDLEQNSLNFESEFEKFVGIIILQNAKEKGVKAALQNLKNANICDLKSLKNSENLADLLKPSGFYNSKAKCLKELCGRVLQDYETLQNFKINANLDFLVSIKGISPKTACEILLFFCEYEFLPINSNAQKLFCDLGYEFADFFEFSDFVKNDLATSEAAASCANLSEIYKEFCLLLDSFCKRFYKGKKLSDEGEELLKELKL